jgi:hypothetical protein
MWSFWLLMISPGGWIRESTLSGLLLCSLSMLIYVSFSDLFYRSLLVSSARRGPLRQAARRPETCPLFPHAPMITDHRLG